MTLNLYAFFHLNLMFSSVEEEQRPQIVERCYWPLLRVARKYGLPIGIEAPACTLEIIKAIDPRWIQELQELIHNGPCEFIGSGYSQIIGPLVPAEVNQKNLYLGMQAYQSILGTKPTIALINEQAYSAGLVPIYKEAGYEAIIMEWNNPSRSHSEWDKEWRYQVQQATGIKNESIFLIWNESIAFQKFQRYAHGELELDELLDYLREHISNKIRCFPLYGSDAEIFDFRPGRFHTEAAMEVNEWERIEKLIEHIKNEKNISWIALSDLLKNSDICAADNLLRLESANQPIPVKKQGKYNVLRWAVTGRDDIGINSRCHRLHQKLTVNDNSTDKDWKELCYLWSSDFRTHITPSRWENYTNRLKIFERKFSVNEKSRRSYAQTNDHSKTTMQWKREGRWLTVHTEQLEIRFNCRRGLAIEYFVDRRYSARPLFGTLHHGRFNDIAWGADFYSGHLVFQSPGQHQITDLQAVEPNIHSLGNCLRIGTTISTPLGEIQKYWTVNADNQSLGLHVQLNWPEAQLGCLRLIPFTLFPEAFSEETLQITAANGGTQHERFSLSRQSFNHGRAISFLVSANQGLGLTDGVVELGDNSKTMRLEFNPADGALLGQLEHGPVDSTWFTRLSLSARELDDTAKYKGLMVNLDLDISASMPTII